MFGEDHEKGGHDHHDGAEIKAGRIKGRDGKPFFRGHIGEIDNAHDDGKDISRDDADKNQCRRARDKPRQFTAEYAHFIRRIFFHTGIFPHEISVRYAARHKNKHR